MNKTKNIIESRIYREDISHVSELNLPWDKLSNKSLLISGASGMIGSMIVDVIIQKNNEGLNSTIYTLGRNEECMKNRFSYCGSRDWLNIVKCDVMTPIFIDADRIDYVLHLASNTHPILYATNPIGTITTNLIGLNNMLEFAYTHRAVRCLFASSNEIYGENRGDVEKFREDYCGYIDSNTLRAGYPESKRCSESLCQAYITEKGLDIVIPRITRTYGPTLLSSDSKALSQFLFNAVEGKDIVLKSEGNQYYSYMYLADTVAGIFTVLLKGENGEAYNISEESSDITLKELAHIVAEYSNVGVICDKPSVTESAGFSKTTKARLDGGKLHTLGWKAMYGINEGVRRTIDVLKDIRGFCYE